MLRNKKPKHNLMEDNKMIKQVELTEQIKAKRNDVNCFIKEYSAYVISRWLELGVQININGLSYSEYLKVKGSVADEMNIISESMYKYMNMKTVASNKSNRSLYEILYKICLDGLAALSNIIDEDDKITKLIINEHLCKVSNYLDELQKQHYSNLDFGQKFIRFLEYMM